MKKLDLCVFSAVMEKDGKFVSRICDDSGDTWAKVYGETVAEAERRAKYLTGQDA